MGVSSRELFGFVARIGSPPAAESDADLLDRFARTGDGTAFAALVHRHGPMVLSVCRRRLGREADAEDAFQAVFLALATSAAKVTYRESLPGWLYRTAYLIALKASGRRARHPVSALDAVEVPMPDPPPPDWERADLKALIDAEVARLPDKFRAVVVLCLVEGRTNAEAAGVLNVPVGTVDSRLSTARKKLQAVLTRRGVAVGLALTLEQMLGAPLEAAGTKLHNLVSQTIQSVLTEVAAPGAGAVSPAVSELARGASLMSTTNLRFLSAVGVALGLLGGAGVGIYFATAADPAKPQVKADQKLPLEKPPAAKEVKPETAPVFSPAEEALHQLFGPTGDAGGQISYDELFSTIEKRTDMIIRVDIAAFRRLGVLVEEDPQQFIGQIYERKTSLPRMAGKLPVRDVLGDALAQLPYSHPCTYQIRGNQIVIVPAYVPPVRPGVNPLEPTDDEAPQVTTQVIREQIYGGVVSVSANQKPLADVLTDLRKQTGANIVLDPRSDAVGKKANLTITLSDVRLYDALNVIADLSELKLVYSGNIYYITTPANAKTFLGTPKPTQAQMMGTPQTTFPPQVGGPPPKP